ncbi:hypothetical protein [Spiroplasma monobiae]|uniref:Uncharacterized protein n=1 Tax=Spiroplasma monobiae MQ-1 TaxID=1336748 RepID=A0A2K9LVU7_SPISQ|nr:hypothetical protein [Spiroplasma monobiae]AUM62505.1 hypothetical protein SMONO_v1c02540 [Spiroplasma monobiae MQ-1]
MNKSNLNRLIKLNIISILKSKSLIVNVSIIFLNLLIFTIIYSLNSADYIYKKTAIVNIETMITICLFGVFSIIMVGHLLSSGEAKNFQQLEQRYGIKAKFSYFFRIITISCLLTALTFIYFLIQTLAISFQDNHSEALSIICLPKINLILYNLLILAITVLMGVLLKASLGNVLATLFLASVAVGPFFSFLGNEYSSKDKGIEEIITENNFKIYIGSEFHDTLLKDGINIYDNKLNLFNNLTTDGNAYYKGKQNFKSIIINPNQSDDYINSLFLSYYMGQTLNKISDDQSEKQVFEFDDEYYEMIILLKKSIEEVGTSGAYNIEQVPFYVEPSKYKGKLNLDKTLKSLYKTEFGIKYKNLLDFIYKNYYSIFNQIGYNSRNNPLFGRYNYVDTPFSNKYSNYFEFYEKYPEFLAISQVINIGFMNSFNTTIFYEQISRNGKYSFLELRDYNDYYKDIKLKQFLNFFNFVAYQNTAFAEDKYAKFIQYSEPSLNYIDQIYQINFNSLNDVYKPLEGQTPGSSSFNPMNTNFSIFDKGALKIRTTGIILYSYIVEISLVIAFTYVGFIFFRKNQKI